MKLDSETIVLIVVSSFTAMTLRRIDFASPQSRHQRNGRVVGAGMKARVSAGCNEVDLCGVRGAGVFAADGEGTSGQAVIAVARIGIAVHLPGAIAGR